jgi:hypothetical protein
MTAPLPPPRRRPGRLPPSVLGGRALRAAAFRLGGHRVPLVVQG